MTHRELLEIVEEARQLTMPDQSAWFALDELASALRRRLGMEGTATIIDDKPDVDGAPV